MKRDHQEGDSSEELDQAAARRIRRSGYENEKQTADVDGGVRDRDPFASVAPAEVTVALRTLFERLPEEAWLRPATTMSDRQLDEEGGGVTFAPSEQPAADDQPSSPTLLDLPDSVLVRIASLLDPHVIDGTYFALCRRLRSVVGAADNASAVGLARLESVLGHFSVLGLYASRIHRSVDGGWEAALPFFVEVSRRMQENAYGLDVSVPRLHRALVGEQALQALVGAKGGLLCFRGLEAQVYGEDVKIGEGFKEHFDDGRMPMRGRRRLGKLKRRVRPSFELCFGPGNRWPRALVGDIETSLGADDEDAPYMKAWLDNARRELSAEQQQQSSSSTSSALDENPTHGISPCTRDRITRGLLPVVWLLDLGDTCGGHPVHLAVGPPPLGRRAVGGATGGSSSDAYAGVCPYQWAGNRSSPLSTETPWVEANNDFFPWGPAYRNHIYSREYRWPSLAALFCLGTDIDFERLNWGRKDWQMNALAWLAAHRVEPFCGSSPACSRFIEGVLNIEQGLTVESIGDEHEAYADVVSAWTINFTRDVLAGNVCLAEATDYIEQLS